MNTLQALSSPFLSLSSSCDTLLSIGKKIMSDVEQIQASNRLMQVSSEVDKVLKVLEEKEGKINKLESDFNEKVNKVESELRAREQLLEKRIKEVEERETRINEKERWWQDSEIEKRLKEKEKSLKEREEDLNSREVRVKPREITEEKIKESVSQTPPVIKIHVGGDVFVVERSTILKYPSSLLGVMVTNGQFKEGELVFIDRDPTYFPVILNIMRGHGRPQDIKLLQLDEVSREFDFYLQNAKIITSFLNEKPLLPFMKIFLEWIPKRIGAMIYKASRDGKLSEVFHTLCDNKGPTLCIIQSNGHLFGGYADDSWETINDGSLKYSQSTNTFLFTLSNPHNIPPTRYFINNNDSDAVSMTFYKDNFGIWFGGKKGSSSAEMTVIGSEVGIFFPNSFIDTTGKGKETFTDKDGWQPFDEIFVFSVV